MAHDNLNRLIGEVHSELDGIEAAAERSGEIRLALRRGKSFNDTLEALTTLTSAVTPLSDEIDRTLHGLESLLPVQSEDMKERLRLLGKANDAAEMFGDDFPVDEVRAALDRAEQIYSATVASTSKPKIRGIGVPLSVSCKCGDFDRHSTNGDWTSIRHQAKTHAEECLQANPDTSGEFTNNLDMIRHEIVDKANETAETGGLTFRRG